MDCFALVSFINIIRKTKFVIVI